MIILLLFAFLSGLVTIAAPCIWPLLPIILSSSSSGGHKKPLGITLGIATSFAFFTLTLSYIVKIIPFDPNTLRTVAVTIIIFFGFTLLIPRLNQIIEGYVSKISGSFLGNNIQNNNGFVPGFLTGFSLGLVWSPCAGPILATIATLAATQSVNFHVVIITLAYVAGISIPLFIFSYFGNKLFAQSKLFNRYTGKLQQVFGLIMIFTALGIYTNTDKIIQVYLLDHFPQVTSFVKNIENKKIITQQLSTLKNSPNNALQNYGPAPEIVGITKWLNLSHNENTVTLAQLKGKVILLDFWTYTCINCIRTLPHVTGWYEKYKNQGFVVLGIHTPEFEFEKNTQNVRDALKRYKITYPVAQDNNYATWHAYSNQYWPAHYLIDSKGIIRDTHFGEGNYVETEEAIKTLLREAGKNIDTSLINNNDQTPHTQLSPETYLGDFRTERLSDTQNPPLHYYSLTGKWIHTNEYISSSVGSSIKFHFFANKVFLVMGPKNKGDKVQIFIDGKLTKTIQLDSQRLYELIDLYGNAGNYVVEIKFLNDDTNVFAFTFG